MKKYTQLYNRLKNMITSGELLPNEKVPSVRKAAQIYDVSTTTVQNAYFDLCADGYIIAQNKSGYYVSDIQNIQTKEKSFNKESHIRFDLSGGAADEDSFDFRLWQRYIKSALRQKERLLSYSEPKGEYDLRCAVSQYIKEKRNVAASPDRIIIGAGVWPLLQLLCTLVDKNCTVSFPDKSFIQGMGIFSDCGFEVHTRDKNADIIYVSPSHMTRWGDVMPIKRRLELVELSHKNGSLVIEDDYENEFLYNVRPTPSLYALGKGNIIYMGSFSAMLLPGIRISFMVLTPELIKEYNKKSFRFAQTASKTEQIALCNYIRDGHIKSQTRKIKRLYCAKTKAFCDLLKKEMPDYKSEIGENTLQIKLCGKFYGKISDFEEFGLKVFIEEYKNETIKMVISPSAIPQKCISDAVNALKTVLKGKKI